MPFFVNADHHRINGGNFQEVGGTLNQQHYDNSVQVNGQGNAVSYVQGPYQNTSSSSIINNAGSGQLTVIGQGDNVRVHLDHFGGFQEYDGMNQMTPHPRMHPNMPPYNNNYAASWHSPPEPHHFDPPMGHPQPFVSQQTMYQSNFPDVNHFPRAHVPSTTTYGTTSPISPVMNQNWLNRNEPFEVARSSAPVEHSVNTDSFNTPRAPSPVTMQMPVPSMTPPQVPSPMSASVRAPISVQTPVSPASQNVHARVAPISPVVSPPTQTRNTPQESTFTSPASHLSIHHGPPETQSSESQTNSVYQNLTTPYPHRAVDQTRAHGVHHTVPQQESMSTPHPSVSSSSTEARKLERVPSPSPSNRSSSAKPSSSTEARKLERVSSSNPSNPSSSAKRPTSSGAPYDAVSTLSNQNASTSVTSTSTPTVVRSPTTQADRLSARPSEKIVRPVHEVELSVEMPPPAYSLEAERPYQTEDLRQEVTSVINPPSGTGANSQENRYAASSNEAVRQENHSNDLV
ncbi:hypothetical protein Agabi119p4_1059 [Agaricus bisporus var. burnettii]|uniref:Uncharacterized protein n=1 Tax=Agaricus bisporus var. burnettii TaxID=192524 RepID=A0A8H7FBW7_AGABI|nr:hypothetical protein Agabi119p4_1059 [Agaricus bisporus var. burnettii]